MCNIAGYIGKREAAPILIEMMSKEEGWDAAFFTGYATIHDGKIYTDRVVGHLQTLLDETDLRNAPGNIGFIHSRTPGAKGQDKYWGHPFMGKGDRHVYIYNGSMGMFKGKSNDFQRELFDSLRDDDYQFLSEMPVAPEKTSVFGDVTIHTSELRSHYSTSLMNSGVTPEDALMAGNCNIPTEIVTLMMSLDEPDCIFYSKTSYPMFVGIASHGMYLATTPQAFPEDVQRVIYLNNMSGGRVYADRFTVKPYEKMPAPIAQVTPTLWQRAYNLCVEMIRQQPRRYPELEVAVRKLFLEMQPDRLSTEAPVVYGILYDLEKTGKIEKIIGSVPGQNEGMLAPKFYAKWIDAE